MNDNHYADTLKVLSRDQVKEVMLLVNDDIDFDVAVKQVKGE